MGDLARLVQVELVEDLSDIICREVETIDTVPQVLSRQKHLLAIELTSALHIDHLERKSARVVQLLVQCWQECQPESHGNPSLLLKFLEPLEHI